MSSGMEDRLVQPDSPDYPDYQMLLEISARTGEKSHEALARDFRAEYLDVHGRAWPREKDEMLQKWSRRHAAVNVTLTGTLSAIKTYVGTVASEGLEAGKEINAALGDRVRRDALAGDRLKADIQAAIKVMREAQASGKSEAEVGRAFASKLAELRGVPVEDIVADMEKPGRYVIPDRMGR